MNTLRHLKFLFTSFHGRIGRKSWWFGFLLTLAVSFQINWFVNPPAFDGENYQAVEPPIWLSLASFVMLVPILALTVKRLNDRDHPQWMRYVFGALSVFSVFTPHLDLIAEPQNLSTSEWSLLAIPALIGIWFFIDNGFLKGTPGPNRYGPDPLDPTAGPTAGNPVPARSARTRGDWTRDVLVGVLGCIAAAFLLLPGLSIESTVRWSMERILPSLDDLNKEMKANPSAWNAFNTGKSEAEKRSYKQAIEHYSQAINAYGSDSKAAGRVLMWRGHALRRLDRNAEAANDYSAAITLEPDAGHRYSYRGKAHVALEQYKTAIKDFDKAISLDPDLAYVHRYRGDALRESSRYDEALVSYDMSIETAEGNFAQTEALSTFLPKAKADESLKIMQEIRDKEIANSLVGRGRTYRDKGDITGAEREFNKALALRPHHRWVYVHRGWLYEKQGQIEKARADYEKAAELGEPNDWLKRALDRVRQQ